MSHENIMASEGIMLPHIFQQCGSSGSSGSRPATRCHTVGVFLMGAAQWGAFGHLSKSCIAGGSQWIYCFGDRSKDDTIPLRMRTGSGVVGVGAVELHDDHLPMWSGTLLYMEIWHHQHREKPKLKFFGNSSKFWEYHNIFAVSGISRNFQYLQVPPYSPWKCLEIFTNNDRIQHDFPRISGSF